MAGGQMHLVTSVATLFQHIAHSQSNIHVQISHVYLENYHFKATIP